MKYVFAALLLASAGSLSAAQPEAISATGLWKIAGDVYGHPVDMMCQLTQTTQKLSGTCSTATDGFVAHKIDGSVKGQKFQMHFQSAFAGNSIMLIVDGKVDDDGSHVSGHLDVEPIGVGGKFEGERASDTNAASGPRPAPSESSNSLDALSAPASQDISGPWNIDANFGRTPIHFVCELSQKQQAIGGTCTGDDAVPRPVAGEVMVQGLRWRFQSQYQGQPIDVSMSANVTGQDAAGMRGSVSVAPLNVIGEFTATRQPGTQPSTAGTLPVP